MAQNRSENTYQKINAIFFRDTNNIIMPYDEFVNPAFAYLRNLKWHAEEKIDGTNIRLEVTSDLSFNDNFVLEGVNFKVAYKGKTDNAQVPKALMAYLTETFPKEKILTSLGLKSFIPVSEWAEYKWGEQYPHGTFCPDPNHIPKIYTIYGEGYGAGIQSGGYYSKTPKFIGFDVKVNDLYLNIENRNDILTKLGADIVPYMGEFTIDEAINFVKAGFNSNRAEVESHLAEGLVLRTPCGLKDRMGNRLIFKVKTCDFEKYYKKYGTLDPVHQERNPHLGGE